MINCYNTTTKEDKYPQCIICLKTITCEEYNDRGLCKKCKLKEDQFKSKYDIR